MTKRLFTSITDVNCPEILSCDEHGKNPAFSITFRANGKIPFPQVILHGQGQQKLIRDDLIKTTRLGVADYRYTAQIPEGLLEAGNVTVQIEGCRVADLSQATSEDWIKTFCELKLHATSPKPSPKIEVIGAIKVYFGIHKHMHQPYYRAADTQYWDGEKEQIFGSRAGNYTTYLPMAVRQYIAADLPHAGISTSWSGSLIEQLDRCAAENLCGGRFADWSCELRALAQEKTALGYPRLSFSAFGFFHPLMPLIPERDIVRQIAWHRQTIQRVFGVAPSSILFPPETAFHVRMLPALRQAGVQAVIYDSIHRYRACRDYPYAGLNEGMLPPNPSEQCNPPVDDWLQLHNVWAGSKIAPSLLKPEYVAYEDADGHSHTLIAIPAERYIGNEDARGGFGALQYPDVLGQVYQQIARYGSFDPAHPPFFLLHSDGDNHGGGADSYYGHNTGQLVRWLQEDPRFELTTSEDYLERFPPDPAQTVHIEPGAWSGADNGDPQFMKWFSRYEQSYSPDLNSWAVLTALQNAVHSLEDLSPSHPALPELLRLMLTAETSCYWYWTGQDVWDGQVTAAANQSWGLLRDALRAVEAKTRDITAPTIFPPWVTPENPGGQTWGQGGLRPAPREATVHSFVYDISGVKSVDLIWCDSSGHSHRLAMRHRGAYPCATGARHTADYYTVELPPGLGEIRYFIEAIDTRGNRARGALERLYLA